MEEIQIFSDHKLLHHYFKR